MGIIHIENLIKILGEGQNEVRAIDGINLDIKRGFHAIVGPSGSGKSTLLQLIGGLRIPDKGKVQVNDIDLSIFDDESLAIFRRRNVGFIFRWNWTDVWQIVSIFIRSRSFWAWKINLPFSPRHCLVEKGKKYPLQGRFLQNQ